VDTSEALRAGYTNEQVDLLRRDFPLLWPADGIKSRAVNVERHATRAVLHSPLAYVLGSQHL